MATEILAIPEEHLESVIAVIRAGLSKVDVPTNVRDTLTIWCDREAEYILGSKGNKHYDL